MTITIYPIDTTQYGINTSKRVGIVESPDDAVNMSSVKIVRTHEQLDHRLYTRLLTLAPEGQAMYEYDYLIIVYNLDTFFSDALVAEAIIAHELGHLEHTAEYLSRPDGHLQAELEADAHAASQGYALPLQQFLINTRQQLINNIGAKPA